MPSVARRLAGVELHPPGQKQCRKSSLTDNSIPEVDAFVQTQIVIHIKHIIP